MKIVKGQGKGIPEPKAQWLTPEDKELLATYGEEIDAIVTELERQWTSERPE